MKKKINDGGPAFPRVGHKEHTGPGLCEIVREQGGMSLRAWLTGMALQGMLTHEEAFGNPDKAAGWAVEQADCVIAELDKEADK